MNNYLETRNGRYLRVDAPQPESTQPQPLGASDRGDSSISNASDSQSSQRSQISESAANDVNMRSVGSERHMMHLDEASTSSQHSRALQESPRLMTSATKPVEDGYLSDDEGVMEEDESLNDSSENESLSGTADSISVRKRQLARPTEIVLPDANDRRLRFHVDVDSDAFGEAETLGPDSIEGDTIEGDTIEADSVDYEGSEGGPYGEIELDDRTRQLITLLENGMTDRDFFLWSSGGQSDATIAQWEARREHFQHELEQLLKNDRNTINREVEAILDNPKIDAKLKLPVVETADLLKALITTVTDIRDQMREEGDDQYLPVDTHHLEAFYKIKGLHDQAKKAALDSQGHTQVGSSGAVKINADEVGVNFADVSGADEAKEVLEELVDFLRDPDKFTRRGVKIPKGVLLEGPPGTGKTLLARAVAGEAGTNFFSIAGSNFVEVYVGTGASRVRDLFREAAESKPAIIFIDEIDAIGKRRTGGDNSEYDITLNELLVQMDGFQNDGGVIVLAATNRSDILDSALMRPGRFDRKVMVPLPSVDQRKAILEVHLRKVDHSLTTEQVAHIAQATIGFSGAELASLVNKSILHAVRLDKPQADLADFEEMRDVMLMGAELKNLKFSQREKENTAYHESGHTLVAALMPGLDALHKVTIVPRGNALGLTFTLPSDDQVSDSQERLLAKICMLLGGRIAEEIAFTQAGITTGASNDLEKATEIAYAMVTQWGFSDKVGKVAFTHSGPRPSEATARIIDEEAKGIIDRCYAETKQLLQDNWDKMERLKGALMERESLDADEIRGLCS